MLGASHRSLWPLWAALGLTLGAPAVTVSVAHACGAFRARTVSPEQRPSLAREKVVLLYDAEKQREHFIREIAFEHSDDPFGFVVPTPSRPQIASLDEPTLFTILRDSFPFAVNLSIGARGGGSAKGSGYGRGGGAGVRVLEEKRVGSFRAFVLEAKDPHALEGWLDDNDFVTTEASKAWLTHYVAMKFYYVAMRYEPPKSKAKAKDDPGARPPVAAETIRISFDTPLPYYPYLEPAEPRTTVDPRRLLELWYVGAAPVVPVATETGPQGQPTWVRPFREGVHTDIKHEALAAMLPKAVASQLPPGEVPGDLVVQTFQDQKTLRAGFGDVLFVPQKREQLSEARVASLERFVPLADATIEVAPAEPAPRNSKQISP